MKYLLGLILVFSFSGCLLDDQDSSSSTSSNKSAEVTGQLKKNFSNAVEPLLNSNEEFVKVLRALLKALEGTALTYDNTARLMIVDGGLKFLMKEALNIGGSEVLVSGNHFSVSRTVETELGESNLPIQVHFDLNGGFKNDRILWLNTVAFHEGESFLLMEKGYKSGQTKVYYKNFLKLLQKVLGQEYSREEFAIAGLNFEIAVDFFEGSARLTLADDSDGILILSEFYDFSSGEYRVRYISFENFDLGLVAGKFQKPSREEFYLVIKKGEQDDYSGPFIKTVVGSVGPDKFVYGEKFSDGKFDLDLNINFSWD